MSNNRWLTGLRSSGVLVSEAVLNEELPEGPPRIPAGELELVRQAWSRFEAGTLDLNGWLLALVHGPFRVENKPLFVLDADAKPYIPIPEGLRSVERPNGVLLATFESTRHPRVLVWKVDTSQKPRAAWDRATTAARRLLRELRERGVQLGLVTDGRSFRLVFVGVENEAWIQWDATRWFGEEAEPDELYGLAWLLHHDRLGLHERACPLIELAQKSRRKQADIADVAGGRLRTAVEHLLSVAINTAAERAQRLGQPHPLDTVQKAPDGREVSDDTAVQALYQAAIRVVMRVVVTSYAEARDLFPLDNPYFVKGYSISNLHETLRTTRERYGEASLKGRQWAWPRLQGLFDLVYQGSKHPDLRMPAYRGQLFRPGNRTAETAALRALSLIEEPRALNDADVLKVLDLVRRSKFVQNVGGQKKKVEGPVDLRDLRTEYIGIMYEGLLDYTPVLVRPEDGAYVVLKGKGFHAFPLNRLEALAEGGRLKEFIQAVREGTGASLDEEGEDDEEPQEGAEQAEGEELEFDEEETEAKGGRWGEGDADLLGTVFSWALKAVEEANLAGRSPTSEAKDTAVNDLIEGIHAPGTVFLMSWKGLRKGSGTYYTRPTLVVPLVERTLEPLLYRDIEKAVPKRPEEILDLKVCDPAMGSGSFLVASAELLTKALYESWQYHGLVDRLRSGDRLLLPVGEPATGVEEELIVSKHPGEEGFEEYLTARLKRHVIEHCIYGVDINPLAVELAKLSLWIETMDRDLPFEFLDHKLREGNSLLGAWLGEAFDYPIAAWDRYSSLHTNRAAGKDPLKRATVDAREWLKEVRDEAKSEFKQVLRGLDTTPLSGVRVTELQNVVEDLYERIHALPEKRREEAYYKFRQSAEYRNLRHALDRWCALWFWPPPSPGETAPRPLPEWFYSAWPPDLGDPATKFAERVAREHKFFHWPIEFPDVFIREKGGFHAVVGNPPWDKIKPESVLFFTRHDPLFPTYSKLRALDELRDLFEKNPHIEKEWAAHMLDQRSQSHFYQNVAQAFAVKLGERDPKPKTTKWYNRIRDKVKNESGEWYRGDAEYEYLPNRPFTLWHGGRELNYYKMFAEQALRLVHADGGRNGIVLPGAIFRDSGAVGLRKTFLDHCRWEWLYTFENKRAIFPIHRSTLISCCVLERGRITETLRVAFMVHDVDKWASPAAEVVQLTRNLIQEFSPKLFSPPMVSSEQELQLLRGLYQNNVRVGNLEDSHGLWYKYDFHVRNDSKIIAATEHLVKRGLQSDCFGRLIAQSGECFLPLVTGKNLYVWEYAYYQFNVPGGWRQDIWPRKRATSERYVEATASLPGPKVTGFPRIAYRDVSNPTDTRTMAPAYVPYFPVTESTPGLSFGLAVPDEQLALLACLGSLCFDYAARRRGRLKKGVLYELPIPPLLDLASLESQLVCGLALSNVVFATEWLHLHSKNQIPGQTWSSNWLWKEDRRLTSAAKLDALVASNYQLSESLFRTICFVGEQDPRGFWRVDKDLAAPHRYPSIAADGYAALVNEFRGDREEFLAGWQPDPIHLAARDQVRGPDWRGWNPDESLPKHVDEQERFAIHVHRDDLRQFLDTIQERKFPDTVVEPYSRLWDRVWGPNPDKVVLTWDDCREYARCLLALTKPNGAWDRFQEVLGGGRPYRYIYDPEATTVDDGGKGRPGNGEEGFGDWGSLQRRRRAQRKLKEFAGE